MCPDCIMKATRLERGCSQKGRVMFGRSKRMGEGKRGELFLYHEEQPLWQRHAINVLLTLFPDEHRMLKLALRSTR